MIEISMWVAMAFVVAWVGTEIWDLYKESKNEPGSSDD